MRYSPTISILGAALSVGVLLGSLGLYSTPQGPGALANEFIQATRDGRSNPGQLQPQREDRSATKNGRHQATLKEEHLKRLGPLLVLLPVFVHSAKSAG